MIIDSLLDHVHTRYQKKITSEHSTHTSTYLYIYIHILYNPHAKPGLVSMHPESRSVPLHIAQRACSDHGEPNRGDLEYPLCNASESGGAARRAMAGDPARTVMGQGKPNRNGHVIDVIGLNHQEIWWFTYWLTRFDPKTMATLGGFLRKNGGLNGEHDQKVIHYIIIAVRFVFFHRFAFDGFNGTYMAYHLRSTRTSE